MTCRFWFCFREPLWTVWERLRPSKRLMGTRAEKNILPKYLPLVRFWLRRLQIMYIITRGGRASPRQRLCCSQNATVYLGIQGGKRNNMFSGMIFVISHGEMRSRTFSMLDHLYSVTIRLQDIWNPVKSYSLLLGLWIECTIKTLTSILITW